MPGPIPKDPKLRQRRNRTSTAAVLIGGTAAGRLRAPKLPQRDDQEWHPLTLAWWKDVWRSPMAPEFLQADVHGLYLLADLIDQYWREPSFKLAGEIRQQRQCFGLTPIDRRRLQWQVQQVEANERKVRGDAPSRQRVAGDPRALLHAV